MPTGNFNRPVLVGSYHSPLFAAGKKSVTQNGQTIVFEGFDKMSLDLGELASWLNNFAASSGPTFGRKANNVFQQGQDKYIQRVSQVFDTEGASATYNWAPLSPQRAAQRMQQGFGAYHPILEATGDLRRAATWPDVSYSGKNISLHKEIEPHEMRLVLEGDKVQHDTGYVWKPPGARGKSRVVPPRPFWPDEELDRDLFFQPFVDWVDAFLSR